MKRKHIVDNDAQISSHDEQSDDDDITIASNIVQPAPQTLESSYQTHQPEDTTPTVFIKSDDGPFFEFNHAHISERLRSHTAISRGFPLNNHIISAYHHAAMYYNVTNTGAIVKAYDRSDRNVSIHPVNLLYYLPAAPGENQDHHLGCCLFGFTSGETLNSYSLEHFPNHIRTDVLFN